MSKIQITQMTEDCKALGAYAKGSIKDGIGYIMIDFEGVESESDYSEQEQKAILANVLMHELHHAVSDFFGLEMSDPDGMCGGEDHQEIIVVPIDEHNKIVDAKNQEIKSLIEGARICTQQEIDKAKEWIEQIDSQYNEIVSLRNYLNKKKSQRDKKRKR